MINRFKLEKMVKKDIINEYVHLKQWHERNSILISKLEELIANYTNKSGTWKANTLAAFRCEVQKLTRRE